MVLTRNINNQCLLLEDNVALPVEEPPGIPTQNNNNNNNNNGVLSDLAGIRALTTDAVTKTTHLVEAAHSRFDWFSRRVFTSRGEDRHPNPIAGFVYDTIHSVNGLVGGGLSAVLSQLELVVGDSSRSGTASSSPAREAKLAVLNGVLGDYLVQQNNPLAISMQIRVAGVPQTDDMLRELLTTIKGPNNGDEVFFENVNRRLLILIHGSCNNDLQWNQKGHNHGLELEQDLGWTPIYIHYNTGLHISENGKSLALQLNRLAGIIHNELNKEKFRLDILAHSMGGLVTRSACFWAETQPEAYNSNGWLNQLKKVVFMGTPHQGALLEQGGKWIDYVLGLHTYSEPFSWIGKIRSQGVMDLGYGNVREEDWNCNAAADDDDRDDPPVNRPGVPSDRRHPTPLPTHIETFAIAAVLSPEEVSKSARNALVGDGLVTKDSALGVCRHSESLTLKFSRERTIHNLSHMDLLSSPIVYEELLSFFVE